MSEHTPWHGITPLDDPRLREVQMAYVDGYIICLEDLLEELDRLQQIQMEHVAREDASWARIVPAVYRPVRKAMGRNLESARKTLRTLRGATSE